MKVIINRCFGGFGVTEEVYNELGIKWDGYGFLNNESLNIVSDNYHQYRQDKRLIDAVEKIGVSLSSSSMAQLEIVEIPDDMDFYIHEYDGTESIHESHRSW